MQQVVPLKLHNGLVKQYNAKTQWNRTAEQRSIRMARRTAWCNNSLERRTGRPQRKSTVERYRGPTQQTAFTDRPERWSETTRRKVKPKLYSVTARRNATQVQGRGKAWQNAAANQPSGTAQRNGHIGSHQSYCYTNQPESVEICVHSASCPYTLHSRTRTYSHLPCIQPHSTT